MAGVKKIRYGTPAHRRVLDAVLARRKLSRDEFVSKRAGSWKQAEEQFLAYLPTTENDALRKLERKGGKPQYTTIEIPYSYAVMMTAHTYLTTVFLARNPIFQYTGRHGESADKVRSIEAVMDYQNQVGEMLVPQYIWLYDALKYGVGVMGSYWAEETSIISRIEERPKTMFGIPLGETEKVHVRETVRGYTGNKLFNIRPANFFPDPRIPLSDFQKGEFAGRDVDVSWNTIVKGFDSGAYFNIDALSRMRVSGKAHDREEGSPQMNLPEAEPTLAPADIKDMGYVHLHEMVIELIPKDWGLSSGTSPEKWAFTVANEVVLISAQPLGFYHNKFPFFPIEPELNGYSQVNRGMLEIIKPLNDVMTWLVNSHFFNVRKVMNDQFVVDPSMIEMSDILDPGPGRMLRLKPTAYGMDVRTAVTQLAVTDVTQGHIRDVQLIADIIQRVTGVNDNIMGMIASGGRKTATEVRSSSTFGINRLKTTAEYISAQGYSKLASVLIQTTQQNYKMEQVFRVAGKLAGEAAPWVDVDPESIAGFYDFIPVDGTMPIDKLALANTWKELLLAIQKMPQIAQRYDLAKIFAYTAELAGLKNIEQFRIDIKPDAVLQDAAQRGNAIPLTGGGGNGGGSTPTDEVGAARAAQPRQVEGLGPLS